MTSENSEGFRVEVPGLEVPFNTFTVDGEYARLNRKNLLQLLQMQLPQKIKTFCQFFIALLESTILSIFNKNQPYSLTVSEIIDFEKRGYLNA